MKDSLVRNKEILDSDFPNDITIIGNPDLIKKSDAEVDEILKKE